MRPEEDTLSLPRVGYRGESRQGRPDSYATDLMLIDLVMERAFPSGARIDTFGNLADSFLSQGTP